MTECDRCGTGGSFLYTCPDCGERFCDEHRDAADHGCGTPQDERPVEDDGVEEPTEPSAESSHEPTTDDAHVAETHVEATTEPTERTGVGHAREGEPDDASERGGLRSLPVFGRLFG